MDRLLAEARTDFAALAVQPDATAFQQVGDGGHGFAVVPAHAAHGEDQIAEAVVGAGDFLEG